MTDHPQANMLERIAGDVSKATIEEASALIAGAAALRALAEFRPHHPQAIVGKRYATLVVPYEALMAAREALGDHDLGRVDVNALRQLHDDDRQAHNATMTKEEHRDKWGLGRLPR